MPLLCQSARGRAAGASQDAQAENFLGGCRPQVPFFSGAGGGAGPGLLSGCCGDLLLGQRRVAEPAHALASLAVKPCAHGLTGLERAFTPTELAKCRKPRWDSQCWLCGRSLATPYFTCRLRASSPPGAQGRRQVEFAARTGVY